MPGMIQDDVVIVATTDMTSVPPAALRCDPLNRSVKGGGTRREGMRDWVVDVICVLLSLATGLIWLATYKDNSLGGLRLDLPIYAICSVLVLWRRQWPITLTVLTGLATLATTMAEGAWFLMVITLAVRRPLKTVATASAVGLAGYCVGAQLRPSTMVSRWSDQAAEVIAIALMIGCGAAVRAQRETKRNRAIRAMQEHQQRIDQARHLERARIAREMHDVLAHRLSLLSMHAGALEFRTDAGPEQVASAAGVIRANAHQALEELRDVIWLLRQDSETEAGSTMGSSGAVPAPLGVPGSFAANGSLGSAPGSPGAASGSLSGAGAGSGPSSADCSDERSPRLPRPGLEGIPALVAEGRQAGSKIQYTCTLPGSDDPDRIPPNVARTVYRVVQEGLTNARKHAPYAPVSVSIGALDGDRIGIEVVNPVPSRAPEHPVPGSGLGLIGLGERVDLAGGTLTNGTTPDGQFMLRAELPCRR